ncbi:MAG: SAM-dependent methyltransferase [Alphaproteobacteria bacterium]|nr:SAM-dependent methyltransferase [Alphaproteobacteria bacterium]
MNETTKDRDWPGYYRKTGDRPPRPTLVFALDRFDAEDPNALPSQAVDLGCGGGRDAIEMLRRGWRVFAVDAEAAALDALRAREDLPDDAELDGLVARFEDAAWPSCDLVNSSFALPLCPPDGFARTWDHIRASLRLGGRFAGHLFGEHDSWAGRDGMTFHTRRQAEELLDGLEVEYFDEEEDYSTTVRGEAKHWHVFHIVARKV